MLLQLLQPGRETAGLKQFAMNLDKSNVSRPNSYIATKGMAMKEVHYSERYDTQESLIVPWRLPGGRGFLIRVLLWGVALMLLGYFFLGRGILSAYMDFFREAAALEAAGPDIEDVESLKVFSSMGRLFGSLFLVTIITWVINVSMETAMHKNRFFGEDKGVFPLRFGRDEGRVMLTQFMVFLSAIGLYIGGSILMFMIIALGAMLGSVGAVLFSILGFFGFLAILAFMIMIFIRLAPAAAYGVQHGRLIIFEMWKKTKGSGWNIFGSYLIVAVSGYVILMVIMYIGMFIVFGDMAASGLLTGDVPEDPDAIFAAMAETFNKTSVKISLGLFMIIYVAGQLLYAMHLWGVGNYSAQYISERERD